VRVTELPITPEKILRGLGRLGGAEPDASVAARRGCRRG